jgi:hypothetical protein
MVWGWLEDSFGDDGWSLYEIIRERHDLASLGAALLMSGCPVVVGWPV